MRHHQHKTTSGFTLIELLVSMTILVIMTLILAQIIADSSRAVELGYQQTMADSNARAFLDNIMDDMNQAIAEPGLEFDINKDSSSTYGDFDCDAITFYALLGPDSGCDTAVKKVEYDVDVLDDYWIVRRGEGCGTGATAGYPLLDYVVEFKILMYGIHPTTGKLVRMSSTDELPMFADIFLNVVSDAVHKRALTMDSSRRRQYLRALGRRHFVQASFPSQAGRTKEFRYE